MTDAQSTDLIALLLADHQEAKQLFARFESGNKTEWSELFCELTHALVRHEVAEEEIVYPAVRKTLPDGDRLADERIHEQSEAEQMLRNMEKMSSDDERFASDLKRLQMAVLDHAEKEEQTVFTPLGAALDQDRRQQLGTKYEKAKKAAPTHPHPHAPDTPPGNIALGPVAAIVDRVRDAISKVA